MSRIKLTSRYVEALESKTQVYLIWDREVPGFGVRVSPNGRKSFFFKYRVGGGTGRQRKPTIGLHGVVSCDEARTIARQWALDARCGGDPVQERQCARDAVTMDALCDRFLTDHVAAHLKPRTQYEVKGLIERFIRPDLRHLRVQDVRRDDVIRLHQRMAATPYQANRVLATLSKLFNMAEMWGVRNDGTNPCRHIRKYREASRERFLSDEEILRLFDALEKRERNAPHFVGFIRLAVLTGMRKSEIVTLKWSYINTVARRIDLPDSKTGRRSLPLSTSAAEALQRIPVVAGNPFVVAGKAEGKSSGGIQKFWERLRDEVGISDVRLHDLRHTFASVAAANGISLYFIGHLLGHRQVSTTQRYAHLAQETLQAAADSIGMAFSSGGRGEAGDGAGAVQVASIVRRGDGRSERNGVTREKMA